MQIGNPITLTIVAILNTDVEGVMHNAMRTRRMEGEWYDFTPDELDTLIDSYGMERSTT